MIYLDGSRFFFDIESCFSNLVNSARAQNRELPADESAKELCSVMAKYYGVRPENVKAACSIERALQGILKNGEKAAVPEKDGSFDMLKAALPNIETVVIPKNSDFKIHIQNVLDMVNEQAIKAVFFSNPCFPTSLEIPAEDIVNFAKNAECKVIVDESHIIDEGNSLVKYVDEIENLIVLKKQHFGGDFVSVLGSNSDFDCKMTAEDQAAAKVIFEHDSALKTADRKLKDSIDSLYIRIKKLAIKYDSVERLFRSKSDCVFLKVKDAKRRGKELFENGISVYYDESYFCIFAGDKDENEALLSALEKILK